MQSLRTSAANDATRGQAAERSGRAATILSMLGGPLILALSIGAERIL